MGRRIMFLNVKKLCALLLLGVLLYCEYITYWVCSLAWPKVPPKTCSMLFIADPQIQGYKDEPEGVLGSIQRWDSDRYLRNVYSWVASRYSNAYSIFLGDLIDEGSIAEGEEEYAGYTRRFHNIFNPQLTKGSIYTPGDNDIGGEGRDLVTSQKIARFEAGFGPSKLVYPTCPFVDVIPVSRLTEAGSLNLTMKIEHVSRDKTVVVISHVPLLPMDGRFAERVMDEINPDIIFSAHEHKGLLYTGKRGSPKLDKVMEPMRKEDENTSFKIQTRHNSLDSTVEMSETIAEIIVPTCSYRMGVKEMAVGLAVFSRSGEVVYTNLWVPARFPLLYLYLVALTLVLLLLAVDKCVDIRRLSRRRVELQHHYRKQFDPLLKL